MHTIVTAIRVVALVAIATTATAQVDVAIDVVAVETPTGSDVVTVLPDSLQTVCTGQTYYVEAWVSDVGSTNSGITSAYVDLEWEPPASATALSVDHGSIFTVFESGDMGSGLVDELGGSTLEANVGVTPEWARVAFVEVIADATGSVTYTLTPSQTGVAAFGRGVIPWDEISLGALMLSVDPAPPTPTDVKADPPKICLGESATLWTCADDVEIHWYSGGCGADGSYVGTGNVIEVSPSVTTTYYARARYSDTGCGSIECGTVTVVVSLLQLCELDKLLAPDAEEGDQFGRSCSLSDDVAIIGARLDDDACPGDPECDSGSAYVYRLLGSSWVLEQKLVPDDTERADMFGVSVGAYGDTIVVGSYHDDDACPQDPDCDSGSAYVYRFINSAWVPEQKLVAADGAAGDLFGYSVGISGDTIVIGSMKDDDNGENSGSSYVFRRNDNGTPGDPTDDSWDQEAKVLPDDGGERDLFGVSVAISGENIVIGAWRDDDNGEDTGSAYVFRRDENGTPGYPGDDFWVAQGPKLLPDDGNALGFGNCVAIFDDACFVGARDSNHYGEDSGAAYVFRRDDNGTPGIPGDDSWLQEDRLLPDDGAAGDLFGWCTTGSGSIAVIGAPADCDNGSHSGSAYVFHFDGASWVLRDKLRPADGEAYDWFGYWAAISEDTAIITAAVDDSAAGRNSGSAYIYAIDGDDCNENCRLDTCDLEYPVLVVSSRNTDSVMLYDGATGEFGRVFLPPGRYGLDYPNGVIADDNGDVYVSSVFSGSVLKLSFAGGRVLEFSGCGLSMPVGLLLREDAALLVANWVGGSVNDNVIAYDSETGACLGDFVEPNSGGLDGPAGLLLTADGHLLVSSQVTNEVLEYEYNGATGVYDFLRVAATTEGSGCELNTPTGLALDHEGHLLVGSFGADCVLMYDLGQDAPGNCLGRFVDTGSGGLSGPEGLAWGPNGNLFVCSRNTDQVLEYDGDTGCFVGEFASEGLQEPTYLTFSMMTSDCNENGIPDYCDIADCDGVSVWCDDCNGNGIPDPCDGVTDMNCDGVIDGFDIDPFVLALYSLDDYYAQYPDCDYWRADCNGDGAIDGFDIDCFVEKLYLG